MEFAVDDVFTITGLGTAFAGTLFALALLASGQSSTITGTLAGQVVMEGFMHWRIQPWVRRLITRTLAILPAGSVRSTFCKVTRKLRVGSSARLPSTHATAAFSKCSRTTRSCGAGTRRPPNG